MKLQKSFGTLLLGGALAVSSQLVAIKPANAALLAQYNFDSRTLNNSAPTTPSASASTFGTGAGIANPQYSGYTLTGTGSSRAVTFGNLSSTTKANAISGNTYFKFTLTPNTVGASKFGVKFNQLSFLTDVGSAPVSANAFGNFFVQANIGAGGAFVDLVNNGNSQGGTVYSQAATTNTRTTNTTPSFTPRTIDLSGFTNNGGYFTTPIEFRIYEYDNAGGNGGGLRLDDVRLTGTVAPVPELSTGLLVALSLGGLCIVGLRRKKGVASSMNMAF